MGRYRSSNIEKYYGFRMIFDQSIDPVSERMVRLRVRDMFLQQGVKFEDYVIYFHNLNLIAEDEHFNFPGGLSARGFISLPSQSKAATRWLNTIHEWFLRTRRRSVHSRLWHSYDDWI